MKKKIISFISLFIIIISSLCLIPSGNDYVVNAEVGEATSSTYAIDIRGHEWTKTQDAYLANKAIIGTGLVNPVDIFIDDDDMIYICDTGSKNVEAQIMILDSQTKKVVGSVDYDGFDNPKGIFILQNDTLYVADTGTKSNVPGRIIVFERDENGEFQYSKEFGKPSSVLFAANDFKPAKISVDSARNMYVIGESILDGIIQLSSEGEFLGYFATNRVNKTLKEKMQELIYDDEILALLGSTQAPQFTNVFTDSRGLVYSTTSYASETVQNYAYVKKHNTAGLNILGNVFVKNNPIDIYVGKNDVIYVGYADGTMDTLTGEGESLFYFGGSANNDISGLFTSLSALAVDSHNNIWCLDDKKAAIHEFVPTEYTNLIYEAFDLYSKRDYEASIGKWQEVLRLNEISAIAHRQLGLNYLYNQQYNEAMYHLRLANDRANYSQAFWEVRNGWLQTNLALIVVALAVLLLVVFALRFLKVKKGIVVGGNFTRKFNDLKFVKDMKFNLSVLRHPTDAFYYVKTNKKGSTISCFVLMFVIFAIFLWFALGKGFIFQYIRSDEVDILALLVGFFGAILLVTLCNWLVSSIQDGEGTFLAIYRMVIVSLVPWAISMVIVCLLSYVATTNEVFILSLIQYCGIALSLLLFFLGVSNVHFYTFKRTIISILLTILLIAVIIIVILLIVIMSTKLYQFFEVLFKEVFR